jgi:hypothetical protein
MVMAKPGKSALKPLLMLITSASVMWVVGMVIHNFQGRQSTPQTAADLGVDQSTGVRSRRDASASRADQSALIASVAHKSP